MRRASTTVVAIVGPDAPARVARAGELANVVALELEGDDPLDRAVRASAEAATVHAPYCVHDADPLAFVAQAWVRLFDELGPRGELEVAVREVVLRWRADTLALPDYYLVLDAESLDPTTRHWYLGVLHRAAPARVVPVPGHDDAVRRALGRLVPGRWWPDLDDLLARVDEVVPDAIGTPAGADATPPSGSRA